MGTTLSGEAVQHRIVLNPHRALRLGGNEGVERQPAVLHGGVTSSSSWRSGGAAAVAHGHEVSNANRRSHGALASGARPVVSCGLVALAQSGSLASRAAGPAGSGAPRWPSSGAPVLRGRGDRAWNVAQRTRPGPVTVSRGTDVRYNRTGHPIAVAKEQHHDIDGDHTVAGPDPLDPLTAMRSSARGRSCGRAGARPAHAGGLHHADEPAKKVGSAIGRAIGWSGPRSSCSGQRGRPHVQAVVSLTEGSVLSWCTCPRAARHRVDEFVECEAAVRADPRCRRR